jgi:hypothetical protein
MADESKESEHLYTTEELLQSLLQPVDDRGRTVAFYAANLTDPSVLDALNAERVDTLHIYTRGSVDVHAFSLVDVVIDAGNEVRYYRVLFLLACLRDQLQRSSRFKTLANAISGNGFNPCDCDLFKETMGNSAQTLRKSLFMMPAETLHQKSGDIRENKTEKHNSRRMHEKITDFYMACKSESALPHLMAEHRGDAWLVWSEHLIGSDIVLRLVFRHLADAEPEIIVMVEYSVSGKVEEDLVVLDREFNCDFNDLT